MEELKLKNTSDHLANERTFLAWLRTSIGIMAFGFVVVKFSLFVKQISLLLGKSNVIQQKGYSSMMGIALVVVGILTLALSYLRYKRTGNQIINNNYKNSSLFISVLVVFITLISILLVTYLVKSI